MEDQRGLRFRTQIFTIRHVPGLYDRLVLLEAERIEKRWKLKARDVYEGTYVKDFVAKDLGSGSPGAGMLRVRLAYRGIPNCEQHVVDVTVNLG